MANFVLAAPSIENPYASGWEAAAAGLFNAAMQHEAAGRFDEAFELFAEANRIKRARLDGEQYVTQQVAALAQVRSIFTREFLQSWGASGSDLRPIFIVGMPRSGSTLVEQILASHPTIQGLGETGALGLVTLQSFPFGPFDLRRLVDDYLGSLRSMGWQGGRFVDKSLFNFPYVGLLHLLFPRATILHTVRHPLDVGLSCFRASFRNDGATRFAYDLTDIGQYYAAYRQMMDHWSFALMGRVATIHLENVVADPETEIRRLLKTCDLEWSDQCLRFYETPREIKTLSADQVRRPIFDDGVGRWRRYERHLAPLVEALGSYAKPSARQPAI